MFKFGVRVSTTTLLTDSIANVEEARAACEGARTDEQLPPKERKKRGIDGITQSHSERGISVVIDVKKLAEAGTPFLMVHCELVTE